MFEDRNVKNIHRILEKTAECKPYEFAPVDKKNIRALLKQRLNIQKKL